jgi:hypothetical protein
MVPRMESLTKMEFAESLETERAKIAKLLVKVQRLVARRTDIVPDRKRAAEELRREAQTLAESTAVNLPANSKSQGEVKREVEVVA